jgi:hypothetical protein
VGLKVLLIRGRAGYDHFYYALLVVRIVPLWPKLDNGLVHLGADATAHADDHGLTIEGLQALLEVLDNISGDE